MVNKSTTGTVLVLLGIVTNIRHCVVGLGQGLGVGLITAIILITTHVY